MALFFVLSSLHPFGQSSPTLTNKKGIYEAALMQHFKSPASYLVVVDSTHQNYLEKYDVKALEQIVKWSVKMFNADTSWKVFLLELEEKKKGLELLPVPADMKTWHKIELVSVDRIETVLEQSGWKGFYALYPKAEGLIYLSDIILSHNQTKAVLEMKHSVGSRSGAGYLLLLERQQNGNWKLLASLEVVRS